MANNLAVMWIGIEATTIVSALLIGLGFHKRPLAIEAAWKYIILCTVGITFALLGTFIAYYASTAVMGARRARSKLDGAQGDGPGSIPETHETRVYLCARGIRHQGGTCAGAQLAA